MARLAKTNAITVLLLLAGLVVLNQRCHAATATIGVAKVNGVIDESITVHLTDQYSVFGSITFYCNRVGYSTSSLNVGVDHTGIGTYDYPEFDQNGNTSDTIPEFGAPGGLASGTYDCYATVSGFNFMTYTSWAIATNHVSANVP